MFGLFRLWCAAIVRTFRSRRRLTGVRAPLGTLKPCAAGAAGRLAGCSQSRHPQTLERGASRSPTDVGHDDQFNHGDIGEFNLIYLRLAD